MSLLHPRAYIPLVSLLYPRAYTYLVGILKSFRLSYRNDMTPTIIGTQQQLRSLWRTNTSLTPCHQGAFFTQGFQGTLTHRLTLKRILDSVSLFLRVPFYPQGLSLRVPRTVLCSPL